MWSSSWRTVIFGFMSKAGSSGATFSSSESFPSSTSCSTTAAVAVFETDASAKAVPVVIGSSGCDVAHARGAEPPAPVVPQDRHRHARDLQLLPELVEPRLQGLGRDAVRRRERGRAGRAGRRRGRRAWAWRTDVGSGAAEAVDVGPAGASRGRAMARGAPPTRSQPPSSTAVGLAAAAVAGRSGGAAPMNPPMAITPASATTTSAPMPSGVRANLARRAPGVDVGRGSCPPGALSMMVRRYAEPRQGTAEPPSPGRSPPTHEPEAHARRPKRPRPDPLRRPDGRRPRAVGAARQALRARRLRGGAPGADARRRRWTWRWSASGSSASRSCGWTAHGRCPRTCSTASAAFWLPSQPVVLIGSLRGIRGGAPVLHGEDGAGRPEARVDRVLAPLPAEPARPPRLVGRRPMRPRSTRTR